jgi:hypothetical protein
MHNSLLEARNSSILSQLFRMQLFGPGPSLGVALAMICACSGASDSNSPGGSGGATTAPGTGGATGNGGNVAAGGAGGGNANTGGLLNTGGLGIGGNPSTGGSPGTGGILNTGGIVNTGGALSTGGQPSAGGTSSTGGVMTTGGKSSTGGSSATGGKSGNAGSSTAGGKTSTGGTSSAGGASTTGGKSSTGGSSGTSTSACSRAMLQTAVDNYLSAMAAGSAATLTRTSSATYSENAASVAFGQGLWSTPLTPDFHRNLLDVDRCQTFSEIIIATGSHPYVLGTRLTVANGQISAISVIATDCDDWGFNAASYLTNSRNEDAGWGPVAVADQLTRQELHDAGFAYFAYWADKTVQVPWGYPCSRLEGGMETNPSGSASVTCDVGIPSQSFAPTPNDYLVDVDYGMIVDFVNLPGPDSHWFRVNKTGIRYIHTLTVCYVNGTWQCPGTAPTCS